MSATSFFRRLACVALLAAGVVACGGGSETSGPSVSTMSASNVRYGGTTVVTVNGRNLRTGNVAVLIEGSCDNLTRAGTGSEDTIQYTCLVQAIGDLRAHAVAGDGRFIGQLTVKVPVPAVSIVTSKGTFEVELDPERAPLSAANFVAYVNANFYRNVIFHRVVKNTLIQAGGFTTGLVAKAATRTPIALESSNGLKNLRGTIAMARTNEPNSASAQWYVNVVDNPAFDFVDSAQPGYAVFGKVTSGLDVIDLIGSTDTRLDQPTGLSDVPTPEIVITSATQVR